MSIYTTQQIADRTRGQVAGSASTPISGVNQLDRAQPGQISFIRDRRFLSAWEGSRADAALVSRDLVLPPVDGRAVIRVDDVDLALVTVLGMFAPPIPHPPPGSHPAASVDPAAELGPGVAIGPGCFVAAGVHVGDGCLLHANVTVLDGVRMGPGCVLYPGVVIRERCELGARVILHANATIGSDGFGYTPAPDGPGLVKTPQIGTVKIGDDVEIGSNTCVDRAKFDATTIGDGTKIDNLCQIAHNCRIGRCCILAGQVGLAGSVTVGDGAILGGQVGVADHLTIGAGAVLAAKSGVIRDVPPGAQVFGYPARDRQTALREFAALRKLPPWLKRQRSGRPGHGQSHQGSQGSCPSMEGSGEG